MEKKKKTVNSGRLVIIKCLLWQICTHPHPLQNLIPQSYILIEPNTPMSAPFPIFRARFSPLSQTLAAAAAVSHGREQPRQEGRRFLHHRRHRRGRPRCVRALSYPLSRRLRVRVFVGLRRRACICWFPATNPTLILLWDVHFCPVWEVQPRTAC